MKVKDSLKIGPDEAVLYLELNWFDLTHDAQTKIMGAATSAIGTTENNFTFPMMNVRLLVQEIKQPTQGKE